MKAKRRREREEKEAEMAQAPRVWELYVGKLPAQTGESDLFELFEPFGEVVAARVVKDKRTGRSAGYGFVGFRELESAEGALAGMGSSGLAVAPATKRKPLPVTREPNPLLLQVSNLGMFTDADELYAQFVQYGEVMMFGMMKDPFTRLCAGYASVRYVEQECGQRALAGMNGKKVNGHDITVELDDSQSSVKASVTVI